MRTTTFGATTAPIDFLDADRRGALTELPMAHAVALRLRELGVDAETIGVALDIPSQTVAGLLQMAEAKLDRLLRERDVDQSRPRDQR